MEIAVKRKHDLNKTITRQGDQLAWLEMQKPVRTIASWVKLSTGGNVRQVPRKGPLTSGYWSSYQRIGYRLNRDEYKYIQIDIQTDIRVKRIKENH